MFSVRECEVLKCVARGLSNKEIGRLLKLAPETVKWHLKNIFGKLDVSSRIEAVQKGFGLGTGEHRAAM
jgi:LuxR family maltose regulon positive regulatory protein